MKQVNADRSKHLDCVNLQRQLSNFDKDPWRQTACTVIQMQILNWLPELTIYGRLGTALPIFDYLPYLGTGIYAYNVLGSLGQLTLEGLDYCLSDEKQISPNAEHSTQLKISAAFATTAIAQSFFYGIGCLSAVRYISIGGTILAAGYLACFARERSALEAQFYQATAQNRAGYR